MSRCVGKVTVMHSKLRVKPSGYLQADYPPQFEFHRWRPSDSIQVFHWASAERVVMKDTWKLFLWNWLGDINILSQIILHLGIMVTINHGRYQYINPLHWFIWITVVWFGGVHFRTWLKAKPSGGWADPKHVCPIPGHVCITYIKCYSHASCFISTTHYECGWYTC